MNSGARTVLRIAVIVFVVAIGITLAIMADLRHQQQHIEVIEVPEGKVLICDEPKFVGNNYDSDPICTDGVTAFPKEHIEVKQYEGSEHGWDVYKHDHDHIKDWNHTD